MNLKIMSQGMIVRIRAYILRVMMSRRKMKVRIKNKILKLLMR